MKREPGSFHLYFLLVAFAALFMFGRTAFLGEGVFITGQRHEIFLGSDNGKMLIGFCPTPHDEKRYTGAVAKFEPFTYVRIDRFGPRSVIPELHHFDDFDEHVVHIPFLIFFFLALALPLVPVMWREVGRRFRKGPFCPVCDYSLAGSPSGTCPECGEQIKKGCIMSAAARPAQQKLCP